MSLPHPTTWSRRRFLAGAAAAPLAWSGSALPGLALADSPPGLIVREKDPENLEFPFATLDSFLTPSEKFYVRNHFATPKLTLQNWGLHVVGAVERPGILTFEKVQNFFEPDTVSVTLECAGNNRGYLIPKTKGVQWEMGAVSTAEWTGLPLSSLLKWVGIKSEAVEVVLEGADRGETKNDFRPTGPISFARSLPISKAVKPEVVLAYKMNGAPLTPAHGFPLRAVVGGWYGMASVKWLTRIVVVTKPFLGYWQTSDYTTWQRQDGLPVLVPITEMDVKASIARPAAGEVLAAGKEQRIHGAAWAGETDVTSVDVSTDGGKTWNAARFLGKPVPFCWRLWEYTWTPVAGMYTLLARATDSRGRRQPLKHDPDRRNYRISHCQPVSVEARMP